MQAFIIMNSQCGIKSFKLLKNTICYILNILNICVYIYICIYIWFFISWALPVTYSQRKHFLSFDYLFIIIFLTLQYCTGFAIHHLRGRWEGSSGLGTRVHFLSFECFLVNGIMKVTKPMCWPMKEGRSRPVEEA